MVLVPATTGDFGILPGHVPTVSQLRPGVVSVHVNDKDVKKYFVSGGFAFVHADSTADVSARWRRCRWSTSTGRGAERVGGTSE